MYYWSRTGSFVDIASFIILCALWALGGLLITSHAFHLKQREKLVAGLAAGFLLFIVLSNLLAQILPLTVAYWSSSGIIFLIGVAPGDCFPKKVCNLYLRSFSGWPQIIILVSSNSGFYPDPARPGNFR